MKKTFLPCALLMALGTSAQAQSNVTLYGLLDLNVSNYKAGSAAGGASRTDMNDGTTNGLNGSRWGMRVAEDLGGGLKVNAVLEAGLNADTGAAAQGGRAFGRQVFIGMSHASYGEFRMGRQYVFEDIVQGMTNPFGNALVLNQGTGVTNMGRALPMWLNAPRADNVVQYRTPSFSGFSAGVQVAPGEGTADRFHGVLVSYASGPLTTGLSYEWNKPRAGGSDTNKVLTLGGNYNFGAFKLLGGYQSAKSLATGSVNGAASGVSNLIVTGPITFTATQIAGYTVGVEVPLNAQLSIGANYSLNTYESATGQELDLGKAALAARYGLSKNTFLYVGASLATADLKEYISQKRVVQAGIRTAF